MNLIEIKETVDKIKVLRREINILTKCMNNSENRNDYEEYEYLRSVLLDEEAGLQKELDKLLDN